MKRLMKSYSLLILLAISTITVAKQPERSVTTVNGVQDIIFSNSFEGFRVLGGTISGFVFYDPNQDGNLADGEARQSVSVYLDANYNGQFDSGELVRQSDENGFYEYSGLPAGIHHVRQLLDAPNIQTFPDGGVVPVYDTNPDEVVNYTHSAPGVGQLDVPYGKNASDWPGEWDDLDFGSYPEPVNSVDLVLKPLGVRNVTSPTIVKKGTEVLSLPMGASLLLRFDEAIIDGAADDLLIYTLNNGVGTEEIEVLVGETQAELTSLGLFTESNGQVAIDLSNYSITGPIHYVQLIAQDNGGTWWGFEVIALEAVNYAPADPDAQIVVITPENYVYTDINFGRFAQDLPPTLTIGAIDNNPETPEFRAGESLSVQVNAFDDVALSSVTLMVNGQNTTLDANNQATINLLNPGELLLKASATDSMGQTSSRSSQYYISNSDGSAFVDPNLIGQLSSNSPDAPQIRILSPAAGSSLGADVDIIGTITAQPAPTSWVVEYAQVDLVDPYNLAAPDTDYIQIGSGSGEIISGSLATLPLSTLADDIYFVRVSAQNSGSQVAHFGQVIAKNIPENQLRPTINIDSPTSGDTISSTVDIIGTINSSRTLVEWFAEYALATDVDLNNIGSNSPDWKRFASGTQTIPSSALIGNFDATILRDNSYVVRIVANNDIGLGWAEPLLLEVAGGTKFGRNRLEFDDISIQLAGFPLKFTRVYDSLNADIDGELGYGWSLKLQSPDIGETVPDTGVAGIFGSTPFRVGTRVYINAPDGNGERLGFTFAPEPGTPSALGQPYHVVFTPDPGNYYQLEVPQGSADFIQVMDSGDVYLFGFAFPYNPDKYVLVAPNGYRYTYHEDQGLLGAEDLDGNTLSVNANRISHSSGPQLTMGRDAQGRITDVTDPEGNTWLYGYDSNGDLVSFSDPDMNTSVYSYFNSPAHYLNTVFDPQGRMARRNEYDPVSGRLVAVIDENGNRKEVSFDPQGFTGSQTDARGNQTSYQYNDRGNVVQMTDADGFQTQFEFNDPNNPDKRTRLIDPDGEIWDYQYNSMGQATQLKPPAGSLLKYEMDYDALGNVTRYKNLQGQETTYTYDSKGHLLSENPAGTGPLANYVYDQRGLLVQKQSSDPAYSINYGYDANLQLQQQSDSNGYLREMNTLANGRMTQLNDNNGSLDVSYTDAGRLNSQLDRNGHHIGLVENSDGSLTRTDRNGNVTRVHLDASKQPYRMDLANGGQILTSFDADGNPQQITDPLGNQFQYSFDINSRVIGTTDQLNQSEHYTRNANGDITEIIDRNGKRRTFAWDANRRITFERWYDGVNVVREIAYTYNLMGLSKVDDTVNGQTYTISYAGGLPQLYNTLYTLPGQQAWRIIYTWNNKSNTPTKVETARGFTVLAKLQATTFGQLTQKLKWTHPDAANSNPNLIELHRNPDGTVNYLRRIAAADGAGAISQSEFSYDNQKKVVSIRHVDDFDTLLHPNAQIDYTRDAEGLLLSEVHAADTTQFSYDAEGQVISAIHSNPAYSDESYTYDLAGNRLTSHFAPSQASITAPNRVSTAGQYSYEYDNAGNISRKTDINSGRVTEFSYDHRNRLILATTHPSLGAAADNTLEFEYDYLNRILYRIVNGVKTWVLHDRNQVIAEVADGASTLSSHYFYDLSQQDDYHAVWRTGIGERWFLKDQLGSIRGITDASFSILSWVDYDTFGNLQPGSAPNLNEPLRFAARPYISEIELYDNTRRYYDPVLGRFTQEDPAKQSGKDVNLYRYVFNRPTDLTDPSGESAAELASMLVEILKVGLEANDTAGQLETPCILASMSASNIAFLIPIAAILEDPENAESVSLERPPPIPVPGCDFSFLEN
ncbi:MAG: RHS repeat domain-containing protein [bacterium]